MIAKFALAFSAPLLLSNAAPVDTPVLTSHPYVHQMVCSKGRGTAFQINQNTALTVAHVTNIGGCKIDGIPVQVIETDNYGDFAVVRYFFKRPGGLRLSCEGFKQGQDYAAIGYARGLPFQRATSGRYDSRLPRIPGKPWTTLLTPTRFIPGMSGGAVFSARGEVVGLVNAYSPLFPLSFSLPLSETSLCKRSVAGRV